MTVREVMGRLNEINDILETLGTTYDDYIGGIDVQLLTDILEEYRELLYGKTVK